MLDLQLPGIVAGIVGGPGFGTKHMTSAGKALIRAVRKGKPLPKAVRYWYTQTKTESIRSGVNAVLPIFASSIPRNLASVIPMPK